MTLVADQLAAARRRGIDFGPGTTHGGTPGPGMRYATLPTGLQVPLGEGLGPVAEATVKRYGGKIHDAGMTLPMEDSRQARPDGPVNVKPTNPGQFEDPDWLSGLKGQYNHALTRKDDPASKIRSILFPDKEPSAPAGQGEWWGPNAPMAQGSGTPYMPLEMPVEGGMAPGFAGAVGMANPELYAAMGGMQPTQSGGALGALAGADGMETTGATVQPAGVDPAFIASMRGAIDGSRGQAGFDPTGAGYDYDRATAAGMGPDGTGENAGHWGSVAPVSAEEAQKFGLPEGSYVMHKGQGHPTFHKAVAAEEARGSQIVERGGRLYSVPAAPAAAQGTPASDPMFLASMRGAIDGAKAEPAVMRTGAQPAAQRQPQSLLERILMQLPYGLTPEQAEKQQEQQRAEAFLEAGLHTMAAASRPGSTAFGAMSEGALEALRGDRQKRKDQASTADAKWDRFLKTAALADSLETRRSNAAFQNRKFEETQRHNKATEAAALLRAKGTGRTYEIDRKIELLQVLDPNMTAQDIVNVVTGKKPVDMVDLRRRAYEMASKAEDAGGFPLYKTEEEKRRAAQQTVQFFLGDKAGNIGTQEASAGTPPPLTGNEPPLPASQDQIQEGVWYHTQDGPRMFKDGKWQKPKKDALKKAEPPDPVYRANNLPER